MKHSVQHRALSWLALLSVLASAACSTGAGIPSGPLGAASSHCPNGGPDVPYLACRAGWAFDFDTK